MNKEQFLAMSLPHELYTLVKYFEEEREVSRKIKPVTGYSIEKSVDCGYFAKVGFFGREEFRSEGSLLYILHPLTDLTKQIEHKGEKFVPIVELAKMYYPNHEWKLSSSGLYACVRNEYMTFEYDYGYNCFLCNNSAQLDQLNCLLKTIEWHFDIAGLIEKGEAIDVNTLPENPYK